MDYGAPASCQKVFTLLPKSTQLPRIVTPDTHVPGVDDAELLELLELLELVVPSVLTKSAVLKMLIFDGSPVVANVSNRLVPYL